jgi:hypothetical protein
VFGGRSAKATTRSLWWAEHNVAFLIGRMVGVRHEKWERVSENSRRFAEAYGVLLQVGVRFLG